MTRGWRMGVAVLGALAALGAGQADRAPSAPFATLTVGGRVDAVPSLTARGSFVVVAWAATAGSRTDAFVAVSRDGGRSFGPPARANDVSGTVRPASESGPRVALGPPADGRPDPAITVVWSGREPASTIRLARSTDGGRTFAASVRLEGEEAAGNRGWASVDVDPRGRARVIWLDHRRLADTARPAQAGAAPAAGEHQHHQHPGAARVTQGGQASTDASVARAQESGLFLWNGEGPAREIARGVCYCCRTTVASAAETVVAAWRHVYPGNLRDIALARWVDGGRSFGAVARVSEDRWAIDGCPEDGPSLALDARGGAHLAWPTLVTTPSEHKAIFYATAAPGGGMSARVLVSPRGRFVAHPAIALTEAGAPAIAWEGTGADRGIWLAVRRGGRFAPAVRVSAAVDASYPALAVSGDALVAAWRELTGQATRLVVTRR